MDALKITTLNKFETPVICLQLLHHHILAIATQDRNIIFYNTLTQKQKRIKIDAKALFETNKITFSLNSKLVAYISDDQHTVHIIDCHQNRIVHSFQIEEHLINIIAFDPSSHYLIIGTSQGRVLEYSLTTNSFLSRLASYPDHKISELIALKESFVSALAFKGTLLASSGYGGSVVLSNIYTHANTKRIKSGRSRVDALAFLDTHTLLEGNHDGTLKKVDIHTLQIIHQTPLAIGRIHGIAPLHQMPFACVTSHANSIGLVNTDTMKLLKKEFITLPYNITQIVCDWNNRLYVTLDNGDLLSVDLLPLDDFSVMITQKSYAKAYAMAEHNVLLRHTSAYRQLEQIFSEQYANALKLLLHHKTQAASQTLEPFKPLKSDDIELLFRSFTHYDGMKKLYQEKKYASIYGLVHQWALLKATPIFKKLESGWEDAFKKAYELMLSGKTNEAKTALFNYALISDKRTAITLLFSNFTLIRTFYAALNSNDYKKTEHLVLNTPQLKELPGYQAVKQEFVNNNLTLTNALINADFVTAEKILDSMKQVAHLQEQFLEMTKTFKSVKKFFYFYEKRKYYNCFQLIDTRHELSLLPQLRTLERVWANIVNRCEKAAKDGNIAAIKTILGSLIELSSRSDKNGDILRSAYRVQIQNALESHNNPTFEIGIINYINLFGDDDELTRFTAAMKKKFFSTSIKEHKLIRKERISWMKSAFKLPNNITDGIIT